VRLITLKSSCKEFSSFEDFVKDKAAVWMGTNTEEYDGVDRYRALQTMPGVQQDRAAVDGQEDDEAQDGDESKIEGKTMEGFPDFGNNMRQYWKFDDKCEPAHTPLT